MTCAARIEIHSFESRTLSNQQFLTGAHDAPRAVISGALRLPPGTQRVPAVVLMHGSGGIGANLDRWAREVNGIGMAAFLVDSFTGRGIVETISDQSRLGHLAMIVDAYRALDLLSRHDRIDPARVAVMGFSKGGFAALYSSVKRFQRMHASAAFEFAGYVAFYPPCNTVFLGDLDVSERPIRIFHGTADNYVSVEPARKYVERLRGAGRDVELTEYEGAHHVFDNLLYSPPLVLPHAVTTNRCQLQESAKGEILNAATGRPFALTDDCVLRGATVGYHSGATALVTAAVLEFLREALR